MGEPINPEACIWYRDEHRRRPLPVVDTWWQTETGAQMISPLPGVTAGKPGSAHDGRCPASRAEVVDDEGKPVPNGSGGYLVLTEPWPPCCARSGATTQRYKETYWSRFAGMYFAGDGAKKDEDGDIWLLGRVDDVMNVSGHRHLDHRGRVGARLAPEGRRGRRGRRDRRRRPARRVVAFVILRGDAGQDGECGGDGRASCASTSPRRSARSPGPGRSWSSPELPKTRSGKIMRRLLRDIAENRELGDVTTLADSSVMDEIRERLPSAGGSGDEEA